MNIVIFDMPTGSWIGLLVACLIGGIVAGYFISRKVFQDQLRKNPPVNEKMIKAMYRSMGRTPSEAQVRATIKAMRDAQ